MEIYEQKEVTMTRRVHVKTECDKCKNPVETDAFDLFNAELIIEVGECYPEGRFGTRKEMQLCHLCSIELESLLAKNGYRINSSEIE